MIDPGPILQNSACAQNSACEQNSTGTQNSTGAETFKPMRVLLLIAVLIAGVLILAASKPDTFAIQRATTIEAPPEKIFALLNDFHNWDLWEPHAKGEPTMKRTFSGSRSGVGAVSDWSGTPITGRGRMTITKSVPSAKISVMVHWAKPFQAHNLYEFTLERQGKATKVTWAMHGDNVYIMKVMSVFMNMDRFISEQFETGLANLKAAAERSEGKSWDAKQPANAPSTAPPPK